MTIFKPELIDEIVAGNKTQTRRPVKPGEVPFVMAGDYEIAQTGNSIITLDNLTIAGVRQNGRLKYKVGRDYAIQPGRGKSCVWWHPRDKTWRTNADIRRHYPHGGDVRINAYVRLRYRLTEICAEDVRNISHADAVAEGFHTRPKIEFLKVWCSFYDPPMEDPMQDIIDSGQNAHTPEYTPEILKCRDDELYQGWVLTFEIC